MRSVEEWLLEGYVLEPGMHPNERLSKRRELVEKIQSDAEQSGYQRGFNEGRKQGLRETADLVAYNNLILEAMNKLP